MNVAMMTRHWLAVAAADGADARHRAKEALSRNALNRSELQRIELEKEVRRLKQETANLTGRVAAHQDQAVWSDKQRHEAQAQLDISLSSRTEGWKARLWARKLEQLKERNNALADGVQLARWAGRPKGMGREGEGGGQARASDGNHVTHIRADAGCTSWDWMHGIEDAAHAVRPVLLAARGAPCRASATLRPACPHASFPGAAS